MGSRDAAKRIRKIRQLGAKPRLSEEQNRRSSSPRNKPISVTHQGVPSIDLSTVPELVGDRPKAVCPELSPTESVFFLKKELLCFFF